MDIPRATEARLREFAPEADIEFERLAVTPMQIRDMNLTTRPTKTTDARLKTWSGGGSVELDAIPPRTLRDLVREVIEEHIDHDLKAKLEMVEQEERKILRHFGHEIGAGRGPGGPGAARGGR